MTIFFANAGSVLTLLQGAPSHSRIWVAALVTVAFTAVARILRGVTHSGAVAGAVICFVLYAGVGPAAFAVLVIVFVLTWLATRVGYRHKERLGMAERREGRKASQVLANLSVAGCCGALYAVAGQKSALVLALVAALAEAAADTVSSEIGQAANREARLITNWKRVPAGTDGGITLAGTLCGIIAATIVCMVAAELGLMRLGDAGLCAAAATTGMSADSVMGAAFEGPGLLNNDSVNFLSTALAAGIAFLFG
jgi:uncharacterized protein (TIGR00297 family)